MPVKVGRLLEKCREAGNMTLWDGGLGCGGGGTQEERVGEGH